MKNSLQNFQNLSREELRLTAGGGNSCIDECTIDSQCCEDSYCSTQLCNKSGNLWVKKKMCQYSGPISDPTPVVKK